MLSQSDIQNLTTGSRAVARRFKLNAEEMSMAKDMFYYETGKHLFAWHDGKKEFGNQEDFANWWKSKTKEQKERIRLLSLVNKLNK